MNQIPIPVSLNFGLTALVTVYIFYRASRNSEKILWVVSAWIGLQTSVSLSGFYAQATDILPGLLLILIPSVLLIAGLFLTKRGANFLDSLDIHLLTVIHVVRVPVELILYLLFLAGMVPEEITFEGGNLDILAGISAPFVYFNMLNGKISWKGAVIWNTVSACLLLNVVVKFGLASPVFCQSGQFGQLSMMLYFPFVFLPGIVVPIALCSHLAVIRALFHANRNEAKIEGGHME